MTISRQPEAVANDLVSKVPQQDALAIALYILTFVAARDHLSIADLTKAIELADTAMRMNRE